MLTHDAVNLADFFHIPHMEAGILGGKDCTHLSLRIIHVKRVPRTKSLSEVFNSEAL